MHKLIAIALIAVLLWAMPAKAAPKKEKEIKVTRVEMFLESATVRVNHSRMLTAAVYPLAVPDDTVFWESENTEIAMVDEDGVVVGISPGETNIIATSVNGKTASCKIRVPDQVVRTLRPDVANADLPLATYKSGEQLVAPALKLDTETALRALPRGERTATLTYKDKTAVSTAALRACAYTAAYEGGTARVRFGTYGGDGALAGQLTVDPSQAPKGDYDLRTGVRAATEAELAQPAYGGIGALVPGAYTVVRLEQQDYGMPVNIAVRANLAGLDPGALHLYHWDGSRLTPMGEAAPWVDTGGFLHFETTVGGAVVVCGASA